MQNPFSLEKQMKKYSHLCNMNYDSILLATNLIWFLPGWLYIWAELECYVGAQKTQKPV